jgi:uncharacterized membrane protein YphA (DoxX/SURF4 family)
VIDHKNKFHDLGRLVYGLAGIVLGIIGLVWRDFAAVWQPLENLGAGGTQREAIAIGYACAFLVAGTATLWRRSAAFGFLVLASLHFIAALGWIPRIIALPGIYGVWNGFFELLSLATAGVVGYACLAPLTSTWKQTIQLGCQLFGVCVISFGVAHFTAIAETAGMVPKWLPPGPESWARATGIFHMLAGVAILTGAQAALASRLLTAMMFVFGVLVWVPALFARPDSHFTWAGNAITFALAGAAWVVADALGTRHSVNQRTHAPERELGRRGGVPLRYR